VQSFHLAGKYRTPFRRGGVANRYDRVENSPLLMNIEYAFSRVPGYVDAVLFHDFDDKWIENARFDPRAYGLETPVAELIQVRFGHLAARGIMDAYEKNLHTPYPPSNSILTGGNKTGIGQDF
jgi:hypothetical protein